jgi:hypothetical protein
MSDQEAWAKAIDADPTLCGVYSDWLEDERRPFRGWRMLHVNGKRPVLHQYVDRFVPDEAPAWQWWCHDEESEYHKGCLHACIPWSWSVALGRHHRHQTCWEAMKALAEAVETIL